MARVTVTERARRLRAQYALQAQDLRGRIERRVNRIPVALRKQKMGDLLAKHAAAAADAEGPSSSKKPTVTSSKETKPSAKASKDAKTAAPGSARTRTVKPVAYVDRHGPT